MPVLFLTIHPVLTDPANSFPHLSYELPTQPHNVPASASLEQLESVRRINHLYLSADLPPSSSAAQPEVTPQYLTDTITDIDHFRERLATALNVIRPSSPLVRDLDDLQPSRFSSPTMTMTGEDPSPAGSPTSLMSATELAAYFSRSSRDDRLGPSAGAWPSMPIDVTGTVNSPQHPPGLLSQSRPPRQQQQQPSGVQQASVLNSELTRWLEAFEEASSPARSADRGVTRDRSPAWLADTLRAGAGEDNVHPRNPPEEINGQSVLPV